MLATTGGTIDVLSTPKGNVGFFYDCFSADDFTTFHIKSEDCPRITKEFLNVERKRMTKLQYMQEYEAEFLDSLQQFFSLELIDSCTSQQPISEKNCTSQTTGKYFLGVDIARYGGDENAFVSILLNEENVQFLEYQTTERISTTDTIGRILELNKKYNYNKIFLDDGGIGGAVLDFLLEKSEVKRKVIGINNASRSITSDGTRGKKILKQDLYGNLKRLLEQKLITIPDDERLRQSLLSIQFEYSTETNFLKIFGKYTHITEGLIRAVWGTTTKGLNIYIL